MSKRAVGQYQHLAAAPAALGVSERLLDFVDRVEGLDRRLQHAVAQFGGEIGVKPADLRGRSFDEAVSEGESGETDASGQSGAAHHRVGAAHRAIADDNPALGNALTDVLARFARYGIDAEPDRGAANRLTRALGQIGAVDQHDLAAQRLQFRSDVVAAHDVYRAQ